MDWTNFTWIIGILGGLSSWLYNESKNRKTKIISEKEARYENLIKLIRTFGDKAGDDKGANDFIVQFQLCWMYCPDEIILKGNKFLDSINSDKGPLIQENINKYKGEFILALRKDLIKMHNSFYIEDLERTNLTWQDFNDVAK